MKIIKSFILVIGLLSTIMGSLPFYFAYPFSNGPNSDPANEWELILMLSYEGGLSELSYCLS